MKNNFIRPDFTICIIILPIYRIQDFGAPFVLGQQVRHHHVVQYHVRVYRRDVPDRTAHVSVRHRFYVWKIGFHDRSTNDIIGIYANTFLNQKQFCYFLIKLRVSGNIFWKVCADNVVRNHIIHGRRVGFPLPGDKRSKIT